MPSEIDSLMDLFWNGIVYQYVSGSQRGFLLLRPNWSRISGLPIQSGQIRSSVFLYDSRKCVFCYNSVRSISCPLVFLIFLSSVVTELLLAKYYNCLWYVWFLVIVCHSNLVDGPHVYVTLAMCWFSRINYCIIKFIFLFS